jgi:hypothetical protein
VSIIPDVGSGFTMMLKSGTNQVDFAIFCDFFLSDIENNPAGKNDNHQISMWDNLKSRLTSLVYQTVEGRPSASLFEIVQSPPYQPKYGPIKYIFCEQGCQLRKLFPEMIGTPTTSDMKLIKFFCRLEETGHLIANSNTVDLKKLNIFSLVVYLSCNCYF